MKLNHSSPKFLTIWLLLHSVFPFLSWSLETCFNALGWYCGLSLGGMEHWLSPFVWLPTLDDLQWNLDLLIHKGLQKGHMVILSSLLHLLTGSLLKRETDSPLFGYPEVESMQEISSWFIPLTFQFSKWLINSLVSSKGVKSFSF